jgi:hypothetical protein
MPLRIKDFLDFDKRDLTSNKVLVYDSNTDSFFLESPDKLLVDTVPDDPEPIPEVFVDQIESQLDVNNMDFGGVDAGTF